MKTTICLFSSAGTSENPGPEIQSEPSAQLVLCFAGKSLLSGEGFYEKLAAAYPAAEIAMCSTSGEIFQNRVKDHTAVVAALRFDHTSLRSAMVNIGDYPNSYDAGLALISKLPAEELCYVLVLSDGSLVNGSELVKGFRHAAPDILITGGLAGDADKFHSTLVGLNEAPAEGKIIAIGFYGNKLIVTHGSQGGWDMFGLEKEITRATGNILYEIDGENALDKYKRYLGPDAEQLPAAALLFPIAIVMPGETRPVVRTILSVDDTNKTMTFAGDVPVGSKLRFMRANFDTLTMAAATAANNTLAGQLKPDFSLLVSCVGRKLILGQRTEEEVEAVCDTLGKNIPVAGFYSYGEISPFNEGGSCQLHNQTMTITSFYELQ